MFGFLIVMVTVLGLVVATAIEERNLIGSRILAGVILTMDCLLVTTMILWGAPS